MKHLKLLVNICFLICIVTACSCTSPQPTPTPQPVEASWQSVQSAGKLIVGTAPDYPPFEFYNAQYQYDGFDIALINEIAMQLGVTVEFMPFAFDGLLTTVQLDQVDLAISAISVTPERDALVDFSNIYYATTDAILVRSDSTLTADTPDLLVNTRLGVQQGSVYQGYAQTKLVDTGKMPQMNLLVYQDISQAVTDLKESRIEAVWLGLLPAQDFAKDGSVKIATQALNQQLLAIALKQGSTALRDKINEALLALQNNGTIARLSEQYLNETPDENATPPPTPTPLPAQPTPTSPPCLNSAGLVAHLSYDDKGMTQPAVMQPGQIFIKGWKMVNNGSCSWTPGYKIAFSSGNVPAAQMGGQPVPVTKEVKPGETFDFQVTLTAPFTPGSYQALWNMQDTQGGRFGATVSVYVVVPAAAPTQTPSPNIEFKAKPTDIVAGETVTFKWETSNVKAVYFYHDGQDWEDHEVDFSGEDEEDPDSTITYYLRVINPDNSVTEKKITINVTQPAGKPVIEKFDVEPDEITLNECVDLEWKVTGQVDTVSLYLGKNEIWPNAPISGSLEQQCPPAAGEAVYKLTASGPGGTAEDKEKVNVIEPQPPTPTPFEPVPDPAAQYCIDNGGTLTTKTRGDGGEYGVCVFDENRQCEEWAMYNGACPVGGVKVTGYATDAAVYCAITGGNYMATGNQGADDEQGTCTFANGQVCDVWDLYNGICNP
jgi:ABC-type amino acid transport substrate-binding protein/putative hemolysin